MSESLIKRYNLDEDDFWTLRGNKIISFDGIVKIIDEENIRFEISDNLDVSPAVAIKVRAYIEPNDTNELHETIEEITFGEANDTNCKNQYFWAMAEKRGKARAALKVLGIYGKKNFYSEVEADDWTKKSPTIKQIEKFNRLEKKALESGILDKDARNWLKSNQNGIRSNVDVWEKAMKALESRGVK
jgi:hypothetical protein